MHVTILQLDDRENGVCHYDADETFINNEERFPDGVEEHTGEDMQADIDTLKNWLGQALAAHGTKQVHGASMAWLVIDTHKLGPLFEPCFKSMQEAVAELSRMTLADFVTGNYAISDAVYKLKSAYEFDGIYIMDGNGACRPISTWLRDIQAGDAPRMQRFYVHAAYDGDQ